MVLRVWKIRLKHQFLVVSVCLFTVSVIVYALPLFLSERSRGKLKGPRNNKLRAPEESWSPKIHFSGSSDGQSRIWNISEVKNSARHRSTINPQPGPSSLKNAGERSSIVKTDTDEEHVQKTNHNALQTLSVGAKRRRANRQKRKGLHPGLDRDSVKTHSKMLFQPNQKACRHKCSPNGAQLKMGPVDSPQRVINPGPVEEEEQERQARAYKRTRSGTRPTDECLSCALKFSTDWCQSSHEDRNLTTAVALPWFSQDDATKMKLLSRGAVLSKARLPGHGQVLQVELGDAPKRSDPARDHRATPCPAGTCALVKRTGDWMEVFAFHLDRVLGLNRSLPAVMRRLHSDVLPYSFTDGSPRPLVWWDPAIRHSPDANVDQNSFTLTWSTYQKMLRRRCGLQAALNSTGCVGVHHSEWGRLALFDFLLQVHDRLDRHCCGFTPDPSEMCVENQLRDKCGNPKDLHLVHILVRETDASRLVFIDNAGRPHQSHDNLNFRLVEGVDQFPHQAVSVLQSGCLEKMLLTSLSADREFWESRGKRAGLRPLVWNVRRRAKTLLRHIREEKLRRARDP